MKKIFRKILIVALLPFSANAYETMYERTPVGKIEVKEIPRRIALEATTKNDYFAGGNNMFRTLFRYISSNDIAMTVPVEAEMQPGKMRFFVGEKDMVKELASRDGVKIRKLERLTVASIGIRGGYTERRFKRYEQKLMTWLSENQVYEATSTPYGVYWNSPFVPGIFKRSEIHVVVRKKQGLNEQHKQQTKPKTDPDKS